MRQNQLHRVSYTNYQLLTHQDMYHTLKLQTDSCKHLKFRAIGHLQIWNFKMATILLNGKPIETDAEASPLDDSVGLDVSADEVVYEEINLYNKRGSTIGEDYESCPPSPVLNNPAVSETGYVAFGELVGIKIRDHRSYHGKISGAETNELLSLATEKGYITRFSEKKGRYVLSVYSPSLDAIQHHLLAVDEEALSYVVKGTGISFQSIEELLDYFEINPINPKMGEIGCSYSPLNTREFKLKHEETKKANTQQELQKAEEQFQKAKLELDRAKEKLKEHKKREDAKNPDNTEVCQDTEESTLTSDNSYTGRTQYSQELEELKKMNTELQQELEKSKSRQNNKCLVQ